MARSRSPLAAVVVLLALVAGTNVLRARPAIRRGPPAPHGGPLTFESSVAPLDRAAVLREIASARPEARRLIARVAGLVTIRVGSVATEGGDAVGLTESTPSGYVVTLDLGTVSHLTGERGLRRLVLHELGHVVDFALVPPALDRTLDAESTVGYGCDAGMPDGSCAPPRERFAETFAKWATGDIGSDLGLGYKVPPPLSLDAWGAPLAALG